MIEPEMRSDRTRQNLKSRACEQSCSQGLSMPPKPSNVCTSTPYAKPLAEPSRKRRLRVCTTCVPSIGDGGDGSGGGGAGMGTGDGYVGASSRVDTADHRLRASGAAGRPGGGGGDATSRRKERVALSLSCTSCAPTRWQCPQHPQFNSKGPSGGPSSRTSKQRCSCSNAPV
eukprot:3743898-Prymnesium_polylepis.1